MDAQAKDGGGGPKAGQATPMMEQYAAIKADYPDSLLFYRMGDFYELFFDDAKVAAKILSIQLTHRGKHFGQDIPMAGVPVHAADEYLERLIASGARVAICEQTEDPAEAKKRGAKAVVRREVVRLVTPGTLTEDRLLDPARPNQLTAIAEHGGTGAPGYGVATVDISTGRFEVSEVAAADLAGELGRIEPSEIIVSQTLEGSGRLRVALEAVPAPVTALADSLFDGVSAPDRVARHFGVATLEGFGSFHRAELSAAAAVLAYIEKTQLGRRPPLDHPRRHLPAAAMAIDAASRASLEITRTLRGERSPTLLSAVDRTVSGAGAQLLAARLAAPSADTGEITARHEAVAHLLEDAALTEAIRSRLDRLPDIARALARLALDRGGPRDLAAIGDGIAAAADLAAALVESTAERPDALAACATTLAAAPADLGDRIRSALVERPPISGRDGGFVADGFLPELDEARALRDESRKVIAALQARYQDETGVKALKIRHNAVLGWFIEVPASHGARLGAHADGAGEAIFRHRQTLASQVRFSSVELSELEARIVSAADRALALETAVFTELAAAVIAEADPIRAASAALAELDVAAGFAELAATEDYVRPVVDGGRGFAVEAGRHPVVARALADAGTPFVANDCDLTVPDAARVRGDDPRIVLVTGPNMGGKSTYLRQNALIAILAQAGSFVPAAAARIGVVDRLFSRIGASDDLARGRSTFMVEMVETAAILNQATPRSLVILDEIGRGTATYDGLSIAWAALEHLHDVNRCRALFATHYHELTALAGRMPRIETVSMRVKEWKGEVVFLHEVASGAADRSYGIQVARLAGMPPAVVARARTVLERLEASGRSVAPEAVIDDLPLFSAVVPDGPTTVPSPTEAPLKEDAALAALDGVDPDELSPREALDVVYRLKRLRRVGTVDDD